jgi:hypothetical protein
LGLKSAALLAVGDKTAPFTGFSSMGRRLLAVRYTLEGTDIWRSKPLVEHACGSALLESGLFNLKFFPKHAKSRETSSSVESSKHTAFSQADFNQHQADKRSGKLLQHRKDTIGSN